MASLQDISFTQNLTQNIGVYPTSEIEPTGVDCVQNIEAAGLAFKKVNSAKSYFLSQWNRQCGMRRDKLVRNKRPFFFKLVYPT